MFVSLQLIFAGDHCMYQLLLLLLLQKKKKQKKGQPQTQWLQIINMYYYLSILIHPVRAELCR